MSDPVPCRPFTYLAAHARRSPRAAAVYDSGETLSFAELLDRVRAAMAGLRALGVRPGEVVGVSLPNVWQYVALEIAVPAIGAVVLPLPPSLGTFELGWALARAVAAMVVTDEVGRAPVLEVASALPAPCGVVEVASVFSAGSPGKPPSGAHATQPEEVVQIALTSGTTGPPKLASLSALLKQLTFEGFTGRLGIRPGDRVLPLSPISQGVGEMCLYALRSGACLIMTSERRFSAERALRLAERARASVIGGVPTMIGRIYHCGELRPGALESLRVTAVAGAPMPPELAEAWERATGARVCNFYGAMDIGQLAVASPEDPPEKRWHTVGRPHERAEMLICGSDGLPVRQGEVGEICMRGPLVQQRYWDEDHGPFAPDGWAHFGDLGFLDEDGFVHVVGRTKDVIIRGGENVNPYEVEALLAEHPGVAEVCLVGAPDPDLGERVAACVVAREGHEVTLESLRGFLESRGLSRHKWVERLLVVDELPLGSSGKVARRELRERVAGTLAASGRDLGGADAGSS